MLETYKCTHRPKAWCLWCCDGAQRLRCVMGGADNWQKIRHPGTGRTGESHSAANSHNSGGSNLIWLEVDLSRIPHGSPPKLTSWIFYRASMSTAILITKWYSGQLYGGGVYLSGYYRSIEIHREK